MQINPNRFVKISVGVFIVILILNISRFAFYVIPIATKKPTCIIKCNLGCFQYCDPSFSHIKDYVSAYVQKDLIILQISLLYLLLLLLTVIFSFMLQNLEKRPKGKL